MTMKKLGKRGLALLIAVLLCVSMMPMQALAAGTGSQLVKSAFENAKNLGQADTCTGTVKLDGGEVTDSGTPNVWPTGNWGGAVDVTGYNWVHITNSNPSVATASYKTEGGKLSVTFTPGTSSGTTKISVGVDAKYPHYSLGTWNMNLNFDYTVTNVGGDTEAPGGDKPTVKPNAGSIYVRMACDGYLDGSKHYGKAGYLSAHTDKWSLGEVVPCDWMSGYEWFCPLNMDTAEWTAFYNRNYGTHMFSMFGHTRSTNPSNVEPIDSNKLGFYWNGSKWDFYSGYLFMIMTEHSSQIDYTVVHEYYDANGEFVGSIPETLANAETGTKVYPDSLTKQTVYGGKEYVYKSGTPNPLVCCDDVTANVITLRYEEEKQVEPAKTYTVFYTDGVKGETVFPDQVFEDKKEGDATPAFEGTPEREGYTFMGWTPAVNSVVSAADADDDGNIIYTATWQKDDVATKTYTVIYKDGEDGAVFGNETHGNLKEGDETPAFLGTTAREGYTFMGWAPTVNSVVSAEDANEDGNIIYTATWQKDVEPEKTREFVLIYHEKLGTDTDETAVTNMPPAESDDPKNPVVSANMSETLTVSNVIPQRQGYTFKHWQWGGYPADIFAPGNAIKLTAYSENITKVTADLYAVWEKNQEPEVPEPTKYTVAYTWENLPEGAAETLPEQAAYEAGTEVAVDSRPEGDEITVDGKTYVFSGWAVQEGVVVEEGKFSMPEANVTISGAWAEKPAPEEPKPTPPTTPVDPPRPITPPATTYTVRYTDGVEDEEVFADKVFSGLAAGTATPGFGLEPEREGYTFLGWEPEVAPRVTGNAIYVAQWEEDEIIDEGDVPLVVAPGLDVVNHYGYIIGYGDGTVRPQNNITRAEIVTIFYRMMEDSYRETFWTQSNGFNDVNSGDWYNNAASVCANAELINGYADGSFQGKKNITRAEFAAIAARFNPAVDTEMVEDYPDTVGHWAQDAIRTVTAAGWFMGDNCGFRPNDLITRAEAMTAVNRMLGRVPSKENLHEDMQTFPDNSDPDAWYYAAVQEATNSHEYEREQRDDESVETWTEMKEKRNWAALEKEWSDAYSGSNGTEVTE